jgi:hypothetical protein
LVAPALHAPKQQLGIAYGRAATTVNSEKAGLKPLSSNNRAKFHSKGANATELGQ